jgi:nicotinamide mononucleotide (NMN) deamidase PncC/glycerol-3-phosphate cytidylyltransferase-like family protein
MSSQFYIICTGGGSQAISNILSKGGASEFFVGAEIPYDTDQILGILREVWDGKYCSERTAHQLASAAYERVRYGINNCGIGVTASLCKVQGERKDRVNQVFVAVVTKNTASTYHFIFKGSSKRPTQELMSRILQEEVCADIIEYVINRQRYGDKAGPCVEGTIVKHYSYVNTVKKSKKALRPVFSGSFNPIHMDHLRIIKQLKEYGKPIVEISIEHKFKPRISAFEYNYRKNLIGSIVDVEVMPGVDPLFVNKADNYDFGEVEYVFAMGADIYNRLEDWEKNELKQMIVFKRGNEVIAPYKGVKVIEIQLDGMSSTEIRNEQGQLTRNEV